MANGLFLARSIRPAGYKCRASFHTVSHFSLLKSLKNRFPCPK